MVTPADKDTRKEYPAEVVYWAHKLPSGRWTPRIRVRPSRGWVKFISSGREYVFHRSASRRARIMADGLAQKMGLPTVAVRLATPNERKVS
jgi:hypothetical protein